MLLGGGGGDNITLSVATNITPANAAVAISPTGTGTVTLNPATASTINNMSIGATTALAGRFTDVTLTTGNLIVASGQGIDFSATSHPAGMTSELLADYEEGTWTPEFISPSATFAYSEQYGSYVKVGKLVTLQMRLRTSSVSGTTSNGINVTGMPFASANLNANNGSAGAVGLCDLVGSLAISIGNNESLYINVWTPGTTGNPTAADINTKYFLATISYRTA